MSTSNAQSNKHPVPVRFVSYRSLLAAEDSFLDKDQTAILAEVEASGEEVDLAAAAAVAAADLARVAPGQGCLGLEGLP